MNTDGDHLKNMTTSNEIIADSNNPEATKMFEMMVKQFAAIFFAKNKHSTVDSVSAESIKVPVPTEAKNAKIPAELEKVTLPSKNIAIKPKADTISHVATHLRDDRNYSRNHHDHYGPSTGNTNFDTRESYNHYDHYNRRGGRGGHFGSFHNREYCPNQYD